MFHAVAGKVRGIPPAGWVALVAVAGVTYLIWHQFANDDGDSDWTTPKETQPPPSVPLFAFSPGAHGGGSPMGCNSALRDRRWPDTLTESSASIIGEC